MAEDAVRQCHRVSPGPDFVLTIQLADMAAYHALVQRLFTADANVRNIKALLQRPPGQVRDPDRCPHACAVPRLSA